MIAQDHDNEMYESITFTNGVTDHFYSAYLHHINFICVWYGLDIDKYTDFLYAETIYSNN